MTTNPSVEAFRWDARRYEQAADMGLFGGRRTELVAGEVTFVAPTSPEHALAEEVLRSALTRALDPSFWTVGGQSTVQVSDTDLPEPDVFVARGPATSFARRRKTAADLLLVAEIGRSSTSYDLATKALRYAAASIPEYWVVDVGERVAHVLTRPSADGYCEHRVLGPGDGLRLVVAGAVLAEVLVGALLP